MYRKLRIAKRNCKRNCKRDWREHDPTYNTAHEEDHGCLKTAFMYSCTPSVVLEVGLIGGCPCPPPSVLILLIRSCSISFKSWFQDEYLSKRRTHRRKKTKQVRVWWSFHFKKVSKHKETTWMLEWVRQSKRAVTTICKKSTYNDLLNSTILAYFTYNSQWMSVCCTIYMLEREATEKYGVLDLRQCD